MPENQIATFDLFIKAKEFVADPANETMARLMKAVFDLPIGEWPEEFHVEQVYYCPDEWRGLSQQEKYRTLKASILIKESTHA